MKKRKGNKGMNSKSVPSTSFEEFERLFPAGSGFEDLRKIMKEAQDYGKKSAPKMFIPGAFGEVITVRSREEIPTVIKDINQDRLDAGLVAFC